MLLCRICILIMMYKLSSSSRDVRMSCEVTVLNWQKSMEGNSYNIYKTANINLFIIITFELRFNLHETAGIRRCISMTLIAASQAVRTRGRDLTR